VATDQPDPNRAPFIAVAWVIPVALLFVAIGVHDLITGKSYIAGRHGPGMHLDGLAARACSVMYLSLGLAGIRGIWMSWRFGRIDAGDLLLIALLSLAGACLMATLSLAMIF
jgi:hypothetical protein